MRLDNRIEIVPLSATDGGGYLARVPDLPGCVSDGETPEGALANVGEAIENWIEAARAWGRPIPQPSHPVPAGH